MKAITAEVLLALIAIFPMVLKSQGPSLPKRVTGHRIVFIGTMDNILVHPPLILKRFLSVSEPEAPRDKYE